MFILRVSQISRLKVLLKLLKMETNRVTSKNLFNFRPAGAIDADILALEKERYEAMSSGSEGGEDLKTKLDAMSDEDFGVLLRGMMDGFMDVLFKSPVFTEVYRS